MAKFGRGAGITRRQGVFAGLAGLGLAASTMPPARAAEPVDLAFDVLWRDEPVGRHGVRLSPSGSGLVAEVTIDVSVALLGRTVYTYRHRSVEDWRGGRLHALHGRTDNNGSVSDVEAARDGEQLLIDGIDGRSAAPADLIPASYWHPDTIAREIWLDGVEGRVARSTVTDLGAETVQTATATVSARRFRLQGDIDAELWYADGQWVGFGLAGPRGTLIRYRLATSLDEVARVPLIAAQFA